MLTILHCALWLLLVCVARFVPGAFPAVAVLIYILLLPGIGCLCMLPGVGGVDRVSIGDTIVPGVATGLNAFAWGYGLSWLMSLSARRRERALARLQRGGEPHTYPGEPAGRARW